MGQTTPLLWTAVLLLVQWRLTIAQTNLLTNPSFEDDPTVGWLGNGFTLEHHTADTVDGSFSVKCSGRDRDVEGPVQKGVPFTRGRHYAFKGYVKILNDLPGKLWQHVRIAVQTTMAGGDYMSYNIAYRSFCNTSSGWIHMKGDIEAPQKDVVEAQLTIRGPDPGVDFLVDDLALYEVAENPNWRAEADTNIENVRKADVTVNVNLPAGVAASELQLEVSLKKHRFAFGSLLKDTLVIETPTPDVIKLAYYLFNWATIQSYKWRFNKGDPPDTNPDFSNAIDATDILNSNGLSVRGHSVLWDVAKNIPDWVKALPTDQLLPQLHKHLDYMVNLARGKLVQLDVQNEHLAEQYYEETMQDPTVTQKIYEHARALGDTAKLYQNEFQCVTSGAKTEEYYDLAMQYLRDGIPLDGLGIQGHTKDFVRPDPTAMWRRIDRLAETGLEIMMTEFDIGWPDKVERADWFEDAIRAFFGHPSLRGVVLWDFWNETMKGPDHALVEGPNLEILESGQRWACLVKKEWTTRETLSLTTAGTVTSASLRGFHGDYEVVVQRGGVAVQRETFTLGPGGAVWDLTVTDSAAEIVVPVEFDYVPQCISHRAERILGVTTSSSTDATLTCLQRMSKRSGLGENDKVSVTCAVDEVMTGCSSVLVKNMSATRNGEKMEVDPTTGQVQCTAYNGRNSLLAVKAYARCCKLSGLACDYKTAGPSFPFDGAMAEARCASGSYAVGCSTYAAFPDSDGVRPTAALSSCVAQSGAPLFSNPAEKSGVLVHAACCQAPGLTCQVVTSRPTSLSLTSGPSQRSVTCPAGLAMTGCHAFAESGRSGGSKVVVAGGVEKCKAYLGGELPVGSTGVVAYATCCSV